MVKCRTGLCGNMRPSPNYLIRGELLELVDSPLDGFEVMYDDRIWPPNKFIQGFFTGPQGSPYANGLFAFTYTFPEDFPYSRPVLKILTRIVHPAVVKGKVCLRGMEEGSTLREVLLGLQEELVSPVFEGCANMRVFDHYQAGKFVQKAQRATQRFAR